MRALGDAAAVFVSRPNTMDFDPFEPVSDRIKTVLLVGQRLEARVERRHVLVIDHRGDEVDLADPAGDGFTTFDPKELRHAWTLGARRGGRPWEAEPQGWELTKRFLGLGDQGSNGENLGLRRQLQRIVVRLHLLEALTSRYTELLLSRSAVRGKPDATRLPMGALVVRIAARSWAAPCSSAKTTAQPVDQRRTCRRRSVQARLVRIFWPGCHNVKMLLYCSPSIMVATERTLSKNEAKVVLDLEWRGQKAVTGAELRSMLGASDGYARVFAHRLVQKGWLQRVRPGLFQLVPADRGREGISDTNPLATGALLVAPYFYSFGTACTHHGFTEQVFAEVYVACRTNNRPVTIRGTRYVFAPVSERRFFGFEEVDVLGAKVQMATKERAVLDALDRPGYAGGIREVSRIVGKAASRLSWPRVLDLARRWEESAVVQRLGYLLDLHQVELPAKIRNRLQGLVAPDSKLHLGARAEWGTSGHLVQPWGIIENVPREMLIKTDRDHRRKRPFPKRST